MRTVQPLPSLALASLALLAGNACSHDKPPEAGGYQQGQVQYGQAGYGGQAGGAPSAGGGLSAPPGYGQAGAAATPLSTGGVGGATSTPAPAAGGAHTGSAQVIDPGAASMVQPIINELAKQFVVAGSKAIGAPLVGNFQTGQTLEGQVQLQPQKCYTVVATALPPVTELNVQLIAVTPLPNLTPVLAADSDTGPTAVIGKKPNCYKWPFPLPAPVKVVAQVVGGSGLAAVQVYEK
jgi:hypothetical protein